MEEFKGVVRWFNNSAVQVDGSKKLKEGQAVTRDVVNGEKELQTDKVVRKSE